MQEISADTRTRLADVVDSMRDSKKSFIAATKASVAAYLRNENARTCLTIIEIQPNGGSVIYRPTVDTEYFGALWSFCFKKKLNGNNLDSAVSNPVIKIVVDEYQNVFSKNIDAFTSLLSRALLQEHAFQKALSDALSDAWGSSLPAAIKTQILSAITSSVSSRMEDTLHSQVGQVAIHAVQTAATKGVAVAVSSPIAAKMAVLLAHNLSVALATHLKVTIGHLLASGAIKTVLVGKLKAIIAGTVLATVAHALAAKLAALGISAGPGLAFLIIVAPVLAVFMKWQYDHLPQKLSETVPDKIAAELEGRYDGMNKTIVETIYLNIISAGFGSILNSIMADTGFTSAINEFSEKLIHSNK